MCWLRVPGHRSPVNWSGRRDTTPQSLRGTFRAHPLSAHSGLVTQFCRHPIPAGLFRHRRSRPNLVNHLNNSKRQPNLGCVCGSASAGCRLRGSFMVAGPKLNQPKIAPTICFRLRFRTRRRLCRSRTDGRRIASGRKAAPWPKSEPEITQFQALSAHAKANYRLINFVPATDDPHN